MIYNALKMMNIDHATGVALHLMQDHSAVSGTLVTDVKRETTDDE